MKKSKIYPVIHYLDMPTTIKNVEISIECGCDGIFLIHMNGEDEYLSDACKELKHRFPNLIIGINRLSKKPSDSFFENCNCGADFTWVDNCGIRDGKVDSKGELLIDIKSNNPSHKIFGAIAFKYQKIDNFPIDSAMVALESGFIVTTSGPSTGNAPDVQKIVDFSVAVGRENLAIASGMTPDNIHLFSPYCGNFLVSTGISKSFYEFDLQLLKSLVENANK